MKRELRLGDRPNVLRARAIEGDEQIARCNEQQLLAGVLRRRPTRRARVQQLIER